MTLLAGLATAILVWWGIKYFVGTKPSQIAKAARLGGGVASLLAAAILAFRGRLDMAFLLGSGAAWLFGWNALPSPFGGWRSPFGGRGPSARQAGTTSRVRSARLDMTLDHDSGRVGGTVLSGAFTGRALDDLSRADLLRVHGECLVDDLDGARLLEPYLDGRFPGWREDAEASANPRGRAEAQLGTMTEQEAYEVLGLQPGAGEDAVRNAHRTLMKKLHPDGGGGSTYLAIRVNQAKDVLLNRHR